MKCKTCGTKIKVGSVYCEKCGKEVQIVPDFNVLDDEIESAISISEVVNHDETSKNLIPRDTASNLKSIFTVGVCAVLIVVFFIFGIVFSKHEKSFEFQYDKAIKQLEDGNNSSALVSANKALELDEKENGKVYELIGQIYLNMQNPNKAEEAYLNAIEQDPTDADAFAYLISYYNDQDNYEKIEELKKKAVTDEVFKLFSSLIVPSPIFSLEPGTYNGIRTVEIKVEGDFPIYYTLDESEPTVANGLSYAGPIELDIGTTVVKAVTYDEARGDYSRVIDGDFTITVKAPMGATAAPAEGHFTEPTYITLTTDTEAEDVHIYYTFDGTAPTTASMEYTEPFLLPLGETKLAVAVINGYDIRSEINYYNFYYGAD